MVTNDHQIVLGRVHTCRLDAADATPVEEMMEPGPTTVRAHEPLAPLLDRMARRGVDEVIVTTPQGELLGVLPASPQYVGHSFPNGRELARSKAQGSPRGP